MALKELRSLNRTMKTGQITCLDCGSNHIAYESADSEFSLIFQQQQCESKY